jgi:hypothetical protein
VTGVRLDVLSAGHPRARRRLTVNSVPICRDYTPKVPEGNRKSVKHQFYFWSGGGRGQEFESPTQRE